MKEKKPSLTAELTTVVRVAESMKPANERVCYDPLAKRFLGTTFSIVTKSQLLTRIAVWCVERVAPGLVGDVIGRVRYIDDYLETCTNDGLEQLVILGAGFDSRPYRFEELNGKVKVFEIDHPATQKVKKDKIKKIFGSLPDHVVYIPIDFNKEKLEERLFEKGYDRKLKTLFIWEGVTMYLTAEAVDETLAFVAKNSGEGSSIIFDYIFKSFLDDPSQWEGVGRIDTVRKAYELIDEPITDERFIFGIPDGAITEFLSQRGFHRIEEVTGEYLKNTYFQGANSNRNVLCVCGFVVATVDHTSPQS
jgi:methyltransferase (TIGR00027 family)